MPAKLITVRGRRAVLERSAAALAVGLGRGVVGPRTGIGHARAGLALCQDNEDSGLRPPKAWRTCSAATRHSFVGRSTSA